VKTQEYESQTRILVVDDVGEFRAFLAGCLKHLGYLNIVQAKDGVDALQQLVKAPTDIVFLDIEMPKQNGMETLAQIRQQSPNTFVIMISSYSSMENVKQAISLGANGFIVKPFSSDKIRDALVHYQQKRKPLGSRPKVP
jgi:two-component system chemotaxis response regulator CheY